MDIGIQGSRNLRRTNRLTLQRILPYRLVYSIIALILFAAAPPVWSNGDQHLKISSAIRFPNPSETLKVWVFFTDKGFATASDQRSAINQYQTQMSSRAQHRRKLRTHLSHPDFTDVPIESHYIEAVLQEGGKLRSQSRWLNGVGLEATEQQIREIARLSFVRAIDPIRQYTMPFEGPSSTLLLPGAPSAAEVLDYGNAKTQIAQIQADFLHQEGFPRREHRYWTTRYGVRSGTYRVGACGCYCPARFYQ